MPLFNVRSKSPGQRPGVRCATKLGIALGAKIRVATFMPFRRMLFGREDDRLCSPLMYTNYLRERLTRRSL